MGEIHIGGRSVTLDRPLKETRVRLERRISRLGRWSDSGQLRLTDGREYLVGGLAAGS
jgi:hypothetical protein